MDEILRTVDDDGQVVCLPVDANKMFSKAMKLSKENDGRHFLVGDCHVSFRVSPAGTDGKDIIKAVRETKKAVYLGKHHLVELQDGEKTMLVLMEENE